MTVTDLEVREVRRGKVGSGRRMEGGSRKQSCAGVKMIHDITILTECKELLRL
jgi:hypothetical protein